MGKGQGVGFGGGAISLRYEGGRSGLVKLTRRRTPEQATLLRCGPLAPKEETSLMTLLPA